jgi:hypothetical protein
MVQPPIKQGKATDRNTESSKLHRALGNYIHDAECPLLLTIRRFGLQFKLPKRSIFNNKLIIISKKNGEESPDGVHFDMTWA